MKKPILIILAEKNFRDTEYVVPKSFFEFFEYPTLIASSSPLCVGRFGYRVSSNILFQNVLPEEYAGVFMVGGSGILEYEQNRYAQNIATQCIEKNIPLAAICAAPRLLLSWNLLQGKKITGWNGDHLLENLCKNANAFYTGSSVEKDGKVITGDGPSSSEETALAFLSVL